MLRDYAWGAASPGKRMGVSDEEFTGLLDYVGGAFRPYVETLGFADAYLIGDDGRVYFSATRGADLGEDLKEGALKASNLHRAWEAAMRGETVFVDMEPYAPLGGKPAAFVAAPVRDHNGEVQGVAALRLPLGRINAVVASRGGHGRHGRDLSRGRGRTHALRLPPRAHDPLRGRLLRAPRRGPGRHRGGARGPRGRHRRARHPRLQGRGSHRRLDTGEMRRPGLGAGG